MAEDGKRGAPIGKALLAAAGLVAGAFVVRGAIQRAGRAKAYLGEGLDEKGWITLGGIEQWVTIRGRDPENPILIVLHGGPGSTMSLVAQAAFPGWDEHFTVVNWDQRGAGRTFGRNGKAGSGELTLGRFVVDGVELAEAMRRRFPGRPIVLLGWSWGSVIGIEMIRARPDLFAAYVGVGQVIDVSRGETQSYFGAIDRLRQKGEERKAKQLEAIGPPPYPSTKELKTQRTLLVSTMPKAERKVFQRRLVDMLLAPDATLRDVLDANRGAMFSVRALWGQLTNWRIADGGYAFEVPLVFLQGELDLQTPTALVTEVFAKLQAPKKELVILEDAGHVALITHGKDFLRILREQVRPLVTAKPKRAKKRA